MKTDMGPISTKSGLNSAFKMGSCALIGFGNTEQNFEDGLMVVKGDNGVDAEIYLFILQVFYTYLASIAQQPY